MLSKRRPICTGSNFGNKKSREVPGLESRVTVEDQSTDFEHQTDELVKAE